MSAIASDATGARLAAIDSWEVYTSSDFGFTWTPLSLAATDWTAIASDGSGRYLGLCGYSTRIWTSSDFGATFAEQISSPSKYWSCIASSNSGRLVAGDNKGRMYVFAIIAGDNAAGWVLIHTFNHGKLYGMTVDDTGIYLTAITVDQVWCSINAGRTWTNPYFNWPFTLTSITADVSGRYVAWSNQEYIMTSSDYDVSVDNPGTLQKRDFWTSVT